MQRKYGTTGHIEENKKYKYRKKLHNEGTCIYKSEAGTCNKTDYINCGLKCRRPGSCYKFIRKE